MNIFTRFRRLVDASLRRRAALTMVLLATALTLSAACGDDADDSAGGSHGESTSKNGYFQAEFTPAPNPPQTGQNALEVLLFDAAGQPLDGAEMSVTPFMPGHGHGTSATPSVTAAGDGVYEVENIVYTMPGHWELTFDIAHGGQTDQLVAGFDVK